MVFNNQMKALIKKYDVQGPRYTSYPTVPQWKDEPTSIDVQATIDRLAQESSKKTIALYTHIPFCEEKCHYCACNVVITRHKDKAIEYIAAVKKELSLLGPMIPKLDVTQIHWGGGTPTYLTVDQMKDLYGAYHHYFNITEDAEISIEVDPRVTTQQQLKVLRELGFNRISLGVQDFDPKVQAAINRNQTEDETRRLHDWCKELGYTSVNMDFVYGLPYQNNEGFEKNLKSILDLNPDRIAFYNYAHVPWMVPSQKYIPEASLPKAETKLEFLTRAWEIFEEAGYLPVGMDHFAKPEDELVQALNAGTLRRNFMGYTTQKESLLFSLGVSSISDLKYVYVQNQRKLAYYYRDLEQNKLPLLRGHKLSQADQLRRHVIMELLCNLKLDVRETERTFNIDFSQTFGTSLSMLEEMVSEGLIEISSDKLQVTTHGRLFIRNICMVFDEYFQRQRSKEGLAEATPKRYSRTL